MPIDVTVQPSEAIEDRVRTEVQSAQGILADLRIDNLLRDPYLLSSIYYHDGLFRKFPAQRTDADPSRRIIAQISAGLKNEAKSHYIDLLHELCKLAGVPSASAELVVPLRYEARSRGRRRTHPDAVDLFANEGSTVYSAAGGLVVLAEQGWTKEDPFSTSTVRGGNTVIVFEPSQNRFYRYCHLASVSVSAGQVISGRQPIGSVGHSGYHASRPRHGGHLHFEINEFDGHSVHSLSGTALFKMLESASKQ